MAQIYNLLLQFVVLTLDMESGIIMVLWSISGNIYGIEVEHSKKLSVNLTLRECKWTHSGPFALSQS